MSSLRVVLFFFFDVLLEQKALPSPPSRAWHAVFAPLSPSQGCLLAQVPRRRKPFQTILHFLIGFYLCEPRAHQVSPIRLMGAEEFFG